MKTQLTKLYITLSTFEKVEQNRRLKSINTMETYSTFHEVVLLHFL
jgi:hypothetical protein